MSIFVLFGWILALPLFLWCGAALVTSAVRAVGREGWRELPSPGRLVLLAVVSISAANLVYTYAYLKYGVILFPEHACQSSEPDSGEMYAISHRDFPISLVCPFRGEVVPPWINPTLFALPAIAVAAIATALVTSTHRERTVP